MPAADKAAERHLLVTLHSQPAHRLRVEALLLDLVALVRREPGCLYYHLYQQADEPDTFVLAAAWVDDAAVAAHPTPAQAQVVAQVQLLLASPMQVRPIRRVSDNPA